MIPMIATYRLIFYPEDEVQGAMIAEQIRQDIEARLDEEDTVDMTQVLSADVSGLSPIETVDIIRKARNALIRTKLKDCWDQARELDKLAYILLHRNEGMPDPLSGYDWSRFIDITHEVLAGKSPVD